MPMKLTTTSNYPTLTEGEYPAVLIGVVQLGLQEKSDYYKKQGSDRPSQIVKLIFEVPTVKEGENTATISKKITVSSSERGNMVKYVMPTLLGKRVSEGEARKYLTTEETPFKETLGKQVSLEVVAFNTDKGESTMVQEFRKSHPKDDVVTATRETIYFDPYDADLTEWAKLTYYTKNEIMSAVDAGDYSEELHKQWARDQEEKAAKEAEKNIVNSALA